MSTSALRMKMMELAVLLASIALFLALGRYLAPFVPDDSYISYRYSHHVATGHGFTFNPDEPPVEGYSNFLWIALGGLVERAHLDLVWWSPRLSVACSLATLLLLWLLLSGRGYSLRHRALTQLLLASSGPFVLYSVSGMETSLFALLMLASVGFAALILESGRTVWVALFTIVSTLGALCRPEGVVLFPLLAAYVFWAAGQRGQRRAILVAAGVFCVCMLAYHGWRISYFGHVFPTPFLSKRGGASLLNSWLSNWRCMFQVQCHYFVPFGYYYVSLAILAAICGWGFMDRTIANRRLEQASLITAAAYFAIYMNFVDWMPGLRYLVPLISLFLVCLGPLDRHGAESPDSAMLGRWARTAVGLCLVLGVGLFSVAILKLDARRTEDNTQCSIVPLGQWFKANIPGDALLAMGDVGAAPYYSQLRAIDIHPRSLTDVHIAEHGWSDEYFFERDPDVVVLVSFSSRQLRVYPEHEKLVAQPRFVDRYRLVGVTRNDWYLDRCYWVYVKKAIPLDRQQVESLPKGVGG